MKRVMLLLGVLAACDSPTVPVRSSTDVYEYRLFTPAARVMRWPIGSAVRVYIAPDQNPALTALLESSLDNAIAVWNDATLFSEVKLEQTSDLQSADAVLQFLITPRAVDTQGCPAGGGFAYTTFCLDPSGAHLATFPIIGVMPGDANSRVKFLVTIVSTAPTDHVQRLVAHELGHVLGIGSHSDNSSDLMYGGLLTRADVSAADRATLQLLYHTRPDITP